MMTIVRPIGRVLAVASLMVLAACQHTAGNRAESATSAAPQAAAQQAVNDTTPVVTVHLAQLQPAEGLAQVAINPNASLYAVPQPVLTHLDLQQAEMAQNQAGQAFLKFDLNQQGTAKRAKLANDAAGNYFLISVRGRLIAVAQVAPSYQDNSFLVPVENAETARAILDSMR